jgi:hypothetical protein
MRCVNLWTHCWGNLWRVFHWRRLVGSGTSLVSDRSEELRKTARECLELARKTTDATTRAVLVTMAQRSLDVASGSAGDDQLNAVLQEYNDRKMSEH